VSLDPSDAAALRQTPAVRYVEELIEIQILALHSHSMINHFTLETSGKMSYNFTCH